MKKVKWLVTVLVVASIVLGVIGCSSPSGSGNGETQQGGPNGGNPGKQPEVHEHTFAEEWKMNENFHWKECTGCKEKLESAEHEYDWTATKEATCTEEGTKIGTCKVCKKEVTEKIDAKGHSGIWETTKVPTETESGEMQIVCEVCGKTVTKELQPLPKGFVFVKG